MSVDIANNLGGIHTVDLTPITTIQRRMKRKRESIQKSIPNNLQKQQKVLRKYKNREHNRIKELLISKSKEISSLCEGSIIIFEDLSTTTEECLKDSYDREYNWVHGGLQEQVEQRHPYPVRYVYARGTSSFCAFETRDKPERVEHPKWGLSICTNHGVLDRDKNASVNILKRGLKYLRRDPFPPSVETSLLEKSVLGNVTVTRQENRNDVMIGDIPNVKRNSLDENGYGFITWRGKIARSHRR